MALTPIATSVQLNLTQHPWATAELMEEAERVTAEVLRCPPEEAIFFIPLEEVDREGLYFLRPRMTQLRLGPVLHFANFGRPFGDFIEAIQLSSANEAGLLKGCVAYALAHGMDIVRGKAGKSGSSLLTGYAHSTLYDDTYDYEE